MSLLVWVSFGFIAGFIASKVLKRTRHSVVLNFVVGIVGAAIGGSLFTIIGMDGMFVAVLGAGLLLAAYHSLSQSDR